jgi:hypothetical protein
VILPEQIGHWRVEAVRAGWAAWQGRAEWRGPGVRPTLVTGPFHGIGSKAQALRAAKRLVELRGGEEAKP